nr:hypothetical protein BaRGS_011042 [Batillaria attramentaria]
MMSALISSLTSVFNSTATIFTLDVWCHIRKHATDVELMIIGRLCVVFLVVVSVIWLPILQEFKELFHYIQAFTAYLAPPMTAVFLLTVFWKRISEPAAFWGLTFGLVMGMIRACGDLYYKSVSKPCGEPTDVEVPAIIGKVHYLHFGFILSVIVLIFTVIFSLFTEEPPESRYMGMTFSTRFKPTSSTRPSSDLKQVVTQQPEHGEHRQLQYFQDLLAGRTFEELPFHTKLCLWMCGIEDLARPQHELQPETMDRSIYEPPNTAMMLHGQMILCLCVITGIWIFYSL